MRTRFDIQLEQLNTGLIEMGGLIESAIASASVALTEQNDSLAQKSIEIDSQINQKERDIEAMCLKLLLHQQPVASDLRLISAALKMITDMERIGDQAADISELSLMIKNKSYILRQDHLAQMARATVKMVSESIDAFVRRDIELAESVCAYDDVVDNLFVSIKTDLINLIRSDGESAEEALDVLMAAKYFERIGDHAVNVAEWVIFSITGTH